MASEPRRVRFVCSHGAARSRVAAALFNSFRPAGLFAISEGLEPQAELGGVAASMLAGTGAEAYLDLSPPKPLDSRAVVRATIAIDCRLADAETWQLEHQVFGPEMGDEIKRGVIELIVRLQA